MNTEKKWFKPTKETGWKKTQKATTRRSKLLAATDKRLTLHNRYLQAARRIQALANITVDSLTKTEAKADAVYFFRKARNNKPSK